jgi:hypothetical protein
MTKEEALAFDLALEALGLYQAAGFGYSTDFNKQHDAFYKAQTAITAIKQARSAQVQEPVLKDNSNYRYDPPVAEPAFHGFMDKENGCVHICYTPWAPRMTDGKLATAYYTTPPAAQPAVPDAITDNSENPKYRAGWNDCRELTIQMRKS